MKELPIACELTPAELVWRAVLVTDEAVKDEKLRGYFHHLHLVQRAFLRAWRQESPDAPFPTFDDAQSLMAWGRSYHREIHSHLETLTDGGISQPMRLPWAELVEKQIGRTPQPITIAETMLQVTLHSLYHRGQINARLRTLGGEPPTVDYIVWVWLGRPAAEWQ